MARPTFGIKTSQMNNTYDEILDVWRQADALPAFEHAWLWDHMVPLRGEVTGAALEAWTLLAALAVQTSRLRLGVMVTSNRLRPPTLLAKMGATVDIVSGGRLDFGIGAGGSAVRDPAGLALVRREFDAYGIDVVPTPVAIAALGEACGIIRRMWTELEPFDVAGDHYRLVGAVCEPKPVQRPHPPVVIGASGDRFGLRVVAQHADIWNLPTRGDIEEFRHKSEVVDQHCAAIGRNPAEIVRSVQVLVSAEDRGSASPLPMIMGPATARDFIGELIDAGASHIVLGPVPPYPSLRWLADEIVEPVRTAVATAAPTTSQPGRYPVSP